MKPMRKSDLISALNAIEGNPMIVSDCGALYHKLAHVYAPFQLEPEQFMSFDAPMLSSEPVIRLYFI